MLISHRTPRGWFYWLDGSPPKMAISDTSLTDAPGHEQVFASGTAEAATSPAHLRVTLRVGDGGLLPPLDVLLQRVAPAPLTRLELRFEGADALADWDTMQAWLVALEKSLTEAQAKLKLTVVLNTRLTEVPPPFVGFHDASRARIILEITDDGLTDDEAHVLADRAATAADLGLLVRPRLVLIGNNVAQWDRRAECYRVACHGWAAHFVRPLPQADGALPPAEHFPAPQAVAEFLLSIYSEGRHDLTHTQPFAAILQALTHGTAAMSRCGAANSVALDSAGRFWSCEHAGSRARIPLPLREGLGEGRDLQRFSAHSGCSRQNQSGAQIGSDPSAEASSLVEPACSWGPLCTVLSEPCEGVRRRNPPDTLMKWRRLFCRTLDVLMPRIINDLTEAASSQRLLQTRAPDSRLRAAAENGRLRVWAEDSPAPA